MIYICKLNQPDVIGAEEFLQPPVCGLQEQSSLRRKIRHGALPDLSVNFKTDLAVEQEAAGADEIQDTAPDNVTSHTQTTVPGGDLIEAFATFCHQPTHELLNRRADEIFAVLLKLPSRQPYACNRHTRLPEQRVGGRPSWSLTSTEGFDRNVHHDAELGGILSAGKRGDKLPLIISPDLRDRPVSARMTADATPGAVMQWS